MAAVVVSLGFVFWRQRDARHAADEKLTAANARVSAVRARIASPPPARARAAQDPAPADTPKPVSPPDAQVAENARRVEAWNRRVNRLEVLHGYLRGFEALHLPAATVTRAEEIMLARRAADVAARANGRGWDEVLETFFVNEREENAQLTALLGAPACAELQAYALEDHLDWTVGTDLWDGGAPLNPDQLHQLSLAQVQTNFLEASRPAPPDRVEPVDPATGLRPQDVALLTQSAAFLSAVQLDLLRQNLIDDNRYNAAMRGFAAKQRALWKTRP